MRFLPNPEGRFLEVNGAPCPLLEYEREELLATRRDGISVIRRSLARC